MRNIYILILISFLFSISLASVFAYGQVLGKKDAKGQIKKQNVEVNVGTVKEVGNDKVKVKTNKKDVEVKTNKNTKIIGKPGNTKLSPGQIKKGDKIATFESKKTEATGTPQLMLVKHATDSAKVKKRRAVYGLVREIGADTLVVSHPIKDNPRYTIQVTADTYIKIKGMEVATITDIKINDRLAAVGRWNGDVLVVKRIHVIPGKAIGLFEKVATPSAIPSATPSASPTATPSAVPSPVISPTLGF